MQPIRFGKYLLVERLAQGGMAEVFRAVFSGAAGFEKQVALKRVLPVFEGEHEFVTLFVDEARISSSLTHVNIAQVFDFGLDEGSYYLAMELVDGVDLGRLRESAARRALRFPVPVAAYIAAEAARGLAYAHEKRGSDGNPLGIVHRDVSPQNLLVSYAGEVKIVDFGIAKAAGKLHKTQSGALMGKIRYMSPEQISAEPLDGRSDLFSLAVILWELLAGVPLWPGDNPGAVADQIRNLKIEPPSRRGRDVPAELDAIVMGALERARDARPAKASDFARALSGWLATTAPTLTREDVGAFVQEVVPREKIDPYQSGAGHFLAPAPTPRTPTEPEVAETVLHKTPPVVTRRQRRSPAPFVAAGVSVLALGAVFAVARHHWPASPTAVTPAAPPLDTPAAAGIDGGTSISDADKLRLTAELEALPRAGSTTRGVPTEDYLALLSAVDSSLCLTPAGARVPILPANARSRVDAEQLTAETTALGRYLFATGELPPKVSGALQLFLKSHPPFSTGAPSWNAARLAALAQPDDARWRLEVIRENGAFASWREPTRPSPAPGATMKGEAGKDGGALPFAALCERAAAVEGYAQKAPGPRAEQLRRYLKATPLEQPVDDAGLRLQLIGAERDDAAATLVVRLRVTNTGSDDKPLALETARLSGLDAPPTVDPPASHLGAGQTRDLKLTFTGVTDSVAEATVLVIGPRVELQAYSEDLR